MYFSDWLILHMMHLKIRGRSLQYTPQSPTHLEEAELLCIVILSVKGQNVHVVNSQQLKYSGQISVVIKPLKTAGQSFDSCD